MNSDADKKHFDLINGTQKISFASNSRRNSMLIKVDYQCQELDLEQNKVFKLVLINLYTIYS